MNHKMHHEDFLEGAGYSIDMNSLALVVTRADSASSSVPNTARIMHEFDHLVRMLGTSYGMVRYALSSLYLHYFLDVFHNLETVAALRAEWHTIARRIPAEMTRATFDGEFFDEQGSGAIYRAQSFRAAMKMLDGQGLERNSYGMFGAWTEMILRLRYGRRDCTPVELHSMMEQLWLTPPPRTELIYIDGRPIRVADILEYLGVVVELAYKGQYEGDSVEFPAELDKRLYLQILNAIRHYIPEAIDPARGIMAQEIEGLLELSLWPPIWPAIRSDELPTSGLYLIPSYRLHYILQACRDINWEFAFDNGPSDVLVIGPRCMELQRRICLLLGWPTPWEIAPRWVTAITEYERCGKGGWSKHFFHHPRSRRTAWTKQLLAECGAAPVSGAMLAGSRHYGDIGFPVIIDGDLPERGCVANTAAQWPEDDSDFRRMDVLLFTASLGAPHGNDWLPESVRTEATETWLRTPLGS
jgi:hypothetical protein